MFSIFNSNPDDVAILIDVGNGTITGALTAFKKGDKPLFLYVIKRFFATNQVLEPLELEMEMNVLFDEVVSTTLLKGFNHKYWNGKNKKIDRILISFSSPWFLSKTKAIELKKEKEFVISKNFLDDILAKEIKILKNELESESSGHTFEVIEKSIVHGRINGYVLAQAIGKSTKNFNASIYMSVVGKDFIDKILDTVHKHTHLNKDKISINTFPLIVFSVIRDLFTFETDFILMDITSEVTDVTLVRNEIIEKTVSMPTGRNFLIRQISKVLNSTSEIAESTLKLYLNKKLDESMHSKVAEIVDSIENEWSIYLENTLLEISPDMNLPSSLFITSNSDVAEIYLNFLKITKLDSTSVFRSNLKVDYLDLEKMKSFYRNESGFLVDEFIVMLALFYKKALGD